MASGTISLGTNGKMKGQIVWSSTSNGTTANTSNVTAKLQVKKTDTYTTTGTFGTYLNVGGNKVSDTYYGSITNSWETIDTVTKTVMHNADGSGTCYIAGQITGPSNTSLAGCKVYANKTVTLDTIKRASVLSGISDFTIGDPITISITKYVDSFIDDLAVSLNGTPVKNVGNITSAYTLTFTEQELNDIYSALSDSVSGTFVFTLTTTSDGATIGTSAVNVTGTININDVKPAFTYTITEANNSVPDEWGVFVKNKSQLQVDVPATAGAGSTIDTITTKIGSITYTGASITSNVLTASGSVGIEISVKDKRTTTTQSTTVSVLDYELPYISSVSAFRSDENGNADEAGNYLKVDLQASVSSINNNNMATYKVLYKKVSVEEWQEYTFDTTELSINDSAIIPDVDPNYSYEVKVAVIDYFGVPVEKIVTTVSTSYVTVDYLNGGKGIAFGKVSEISETADFNLKALFREDVNIESNLTVEGNSNFNSEVFDKYGSLIGNGVSGGVNTDDPNTTAEDILFTRHANCPDSTRYWYIKSYSTQGVKDLVNSTGYYGKKQVAFGYAVHEIYQRYYYSNGKEYDDNLWSEWIPLLEDYVAEQGTIEIWNYRKWNSGKAECWGTYTANSAMTTTWGNLYTSKLGMSRIDYPFTFTNRPLEQVTAHASNGACWVFAESGGNGVNTVSQTAVYNVVRPSSASTVNTIYLDFFITGYWK